VWSMMTAAPTEHWGAFVFIAVATATIYFNFAWFREQLCLVICPYGRIQSALIDDHSLVVGYDVKRGEPRGRVGTPDAGACVGCNRCVQVCPVGIDIRQGLQMECIGCTACIDACDDVMTRLHRPRGLIRYDSQAAFSGKRTRWLRARTILYFVLLLIGAGVAAKALSTVKPASAGVTRMTGAPYIVDDATVRNQFLVRIVNKRNTAAKFNVTVENAPAGLRHLGFDTTVQVDALAELVQPLVLQVPRASYTGPFHFDVRVTDAEKTFSIMRQVEFVGPDARLLREDK
jgi:cytochrome c oxidase accessory protein FixG